MYKLILSNIAVKFLDKASNDLFNRIDNVLQELKTNPRPIGAIKLTNEEAYRIRVGNYRIIYYIKDNVLQIHIIRIAHRKDAYRRN